MGNAHLNVVLRDGANNVLMYFPGNTVVEHAWKNAIKSNPLPARSGARAPATLQVDIKQVVGEVTLQGYFIAVDGSVDADFETAIRALMGIPAATITPRQQWNWTLDKLLSTYNLRLDCDGDLYNAANTTNVATGTYPAIVWQDARIIREGPVNRIDFVLKFGIGKTSMR